MACSNYGCSEGVITTIAGLPKQLPSLMDVKRDGNKRSPAKHKNRIPFASLRLAHLSVPINHGCLVHSLEGPRVPPTGLLIHTASDIFYPQRCGLWVSMVASPGRRPVYLLTDEGHLGANLHPVSCCPPRGARWTLTIFFSLGDRSSSALESCDD